MEKANPIVSKRAADERSVIRRVARRFGGMRFAIPPYVRRETRRGRLPPSRPDLTAAPSADCCPALPSVLSCAWRGRTRAPGCPRAPRGPPPARFEAGASEARVVWLALSASTASGTRSITRRRARAAPCGTSFPCSQPRTVATDMPTRRANSACDSPARRRTRRTQAAASLAPSASSEAA